MSGVFKSGDCTPNFVCLTSEIRMLDSCFAIVQLDYL